LTRHTRHWAASIVLVTSAAVACRNDRTSRVTTTSNTPANQSASAKPAPGGTLLVSVRTEPKSFSWYTQRDGTTWLVSNLTQAKLVRVNRATEQIEPALAESWTRSDDGLRYRLKLRSAFFSDGRPVTADDVLFSLTAVYHPKGGIVLGDSLKVGGRELRATAVDQHTVDLEFPSPFGPGIRLLDNLPILPKHKLAGPLEAGTFQQAVGPATPVEELVGAGPFALVEHVPGQRLAFARNERYFGRDARGTPLPYLDRIVVEIVPDQAAQVLRVEAGRSDMLKDEIRVEDYALLKRAADAGRVQLLDLGLALSPDSFWIDLRPGAFAGDPRAAWIQRDELRQAISAAVDRQLFADTVFLGQAEPVFGPVTPSFKQWHSSKVPRVAHDPARAKALLGSIGLLDRDGDGMLEDAAGHAARFTLLTPKGQTPRERGAAVIRDELKKIGLTVDVVALDGNALVEQFITGKKYDAIYFHFEPTSTDPALNLDFWLSSGTSRVWNLAQTTPATDWERRIDELMARQVAAIDEHERKRLFEEVQLIFAEHLPIVHFVAPKVFVAASTRVRNLTPAIQQPQLLWSAETISLRP
jgi:peptide/nickel transport system substrate-binding protein